MVRILMYHGVGELGMPTETLNAQLRWLAARKTVVPLEEAWRLANGGAEDRDTYAITVDDGLRNFATHAAPLLCRYGLPCTFFVCPGLIDSGNWIWTHEVRQRLHRLDARRLRSIATELGCAGTAVESLVDEFKRMPITRRRFCEEQLRHATPSFSPTAVERQAFDPVTWDAIAELNTDLVTVGSHSSNHDILPLLSLDEQMVQIAGSYSRLREVTGQPVRCFSFPNGDYDAATCELVAQYYHFAVGVGPAKAQGECRVIPLARLAAESCGEWIGDRVEDA